MENTLVYFSQTNSPLVNIQRSYLNILRYTADNCGYKVQYINNAFPDELEYYKKSAMTITDIKRCNSVSYSDTAILVQPNYIFFMLDSLKLSDNTKICLLCGDPFSEKWLYDALDITKSGKEELEELIENSSCRVFHNCPVDIKQKINISLVSSSSVDILSNELLNTVATTELTVGMLRKCSNVKHHIYAYELYREHNQNSCYSDFHKAITEKKSNTPKKKGPDIITFAKRSIKKVAPYSIIFRKFYDIQKGYEKKLKIVADKLKSEGKIKVGFILLFNSVFPSRTIFEGMLNTDCFDPYIIVAPDVSRSMKHQTDTLRESLDSLSAQYPGRVISGYDEENDSYLELKEEYSIIVFCNPYKNLVHPYHEIEYFLDKNVLTVYVNYGLATLDFWKNILATDFYSYLWLATTETKENLKYQKKHQRIKGANTIVAGYPKMDKLSLYTRNKSGRKSVILSPHHTVWGWNQLNISNFLEYSDLFLKLPKMYPEINFIFRPHPLLFSHLKSHGIWNDRQIQEYLNRLLENKNAVYDTSGDYLEIFAQSSAMIHDCGSFIGEYLYTEKPCCYMMKPSVKTEFTPLGRKCIEQHYHAFNENDICNFIEEVVINGNDTMADKRIGFVKTELKYKYPNSADYIVEYIKKSLTNGGRK